MACLEQEYVGLIKLRLGCSEGGELSLGFIKLRPDLNCNGVPFEVECLGRLHLGVGQALAYKYAVGRAGLVVVGVEEVGEELRRFLKWVASLGVDVYVYVGGLVTRV